MPIDSRTKYPDIEKIKKKLRKAQERDDALAHRKQQSAIGAAPLGKNLVKIPSKIDFYASRAWQEVRWKVIKANNGTCVYCGRSRTSHGVIIHVDHIKPRSQFPHLALEQSNLQITCEDCNMGKGTKEA